MEKLAIVGAGAMGSGIAQVAAQSKYKVLVYDQAPEASARSGAAIAKNLENAIQKGRMERTIADEVLSRIEYVSNLKSLEECDIYIEAAIEVLEVKKAIFRDLDAIAPPSAIIATNTSSMSVTSLAAVTGRPGNVAGLHFFNPVPVMQLVEVVRGCKSSEATITSLINLAKSLGKTPVEVRIDSPGFIVNRLLLPQLREAVRLLEEGVASIEDIDTAMRLGLNHPMGPFALQDLAGIDVANNALEYFRQEMGDAYTPPLAMKRMVAAGLLGKKTGRGWYNYSEK